MRYAKYILIFSCIVVAGVYGWYLMASAINKYADTAATLIIQDTLASSTAYDIGRLREIANLIDTNQLQKAAELTDELIQSKLFFIEQCVTDKCKESNDELQGQSSL